MAGLEASTSGFPSVEKKVQDLASGDRDASLPLTIGGSRPNDGFNSASKSEGKMEGQDGRQSDSVRTWEEEGTNENLEHEPAVSSSGSDSQTDAYRKSLDRCISACTKGFVIGAGLRGGLALVSVLSRLKRRKVSVSGKSDAEAVRVALKDTLRYGLFVGTFAGSFCTVDETIAAVGGRPRTARWRALVAGAVAGPSLLLTGSENRHTSMAIYIFMRASVLAARCGIKSERMGKICRPLTWAHGDTFLMCLSSSQILYAWIMHPSSLPSSYISFLNKHGGKDSSIVHGIKALASKKGFTEQLSVVNQYYQSRGKLNVQLTPDMKIPCQMVHGGQGCEEHFISFMKGAYLRALPVYLPVYLLPALLVHRQGLFKKPFPLLMKIFSGTARSSLFLATYCASAWLWTCWTFRLIGTCNPPLVAAGTLPVGLATLIEKKSRRMELALYCFSRAIESFAICAADSDLLKQHKLRLPDRIDVLLFSISTSIIMHCYAEERDIFRSKYLNVLDWVFGIPDPAKSAGPPEFGPRGVKADEESSLNVNSD